MIVAISGGTSGIGAAIVAEGESRGWTMRAGSRRTGLDVRSPASVAAFFDGVAVDGVIACAGTAEQSLFVDIDDEAVRDVLETNVYGAFLFARGAVRAGATSVLLVGSVSQLGAPSSAVYATSKAALYGMARVMAAEHAGVRVNVLLPGLVLTPLTATMPQALRERLSAATALRRPTLASEVAAASADLLASPLRDRAVRVSGGAIEMPL